jgi:hypothetical protein
MDILKDIYTYAKEEPKEFFLSLFTMAIVFTFFYFGLWVAAILEGRV